jgi:hypothetical protein
MSVALVSATSVNHTLTRLNARRGFISEDGVSYRDIADSFLAGDWSSGINRYWSPLYPLLIAGALRVTYPTTSSELLVLHSVNFVVFLLALAAFVSFWRQLDRERSSRLEHGPQAISFSSVHWWLLGYLLFAWSALRLIKVWATTPDMAVLAAVLAAGTLLLKIRHQPTPWLTWGLFGLCPRRAISFRHSERRVAAIGDAVVSRLLPGSDSTRSCMSSRDTWRLFSFLVGAPYSPSFGSRPFHWPRM